MNNEDYTLMKINEALEKNVWYDSTPEFWSEIKTARKRKKEERQKK